MLTNDLFCLKGKNVLVTGAAGYLGREMCFGLAEFGATVFINGRNKDSVNSLVLDITKAGYLARDAVFDLRDHASIELFFKSWGQERLDILVNNAYSGNGGTLESTSCQEYIDSYYISVVSAHKILQISLPFLRAAKDANGGASVINIASMYGIVSPNLELYSCPEKSNPPFYGAAKAALIQWTKYAACGFGKENIRFNSISPGAFPNLSNEKAFKDALSKKIPLQRVGLAHELKGPLLFLASSASSYVNGTNLVVDGGWTAW